MTKLIILVGKSCSGKDTFTKYLMDNYSMLHLMKNYTTRPKRNLNEDEYNFVSHEDLIKKLFNDELIECKEYNNWFYATAKSELIKDKINIISLSIERANYFYDYLKENNMLNNTLLIYMYAPEEERIERYINRIKHDEKIISLKNLEEIVRRFKTEKEDYKKETLEDFPNIIYYNTSSKICCNKEKDKILTSINNFIK